MGANFLFLLFPGKMVDVTLSLYPKIDYFRLNIDELLYSVDYIMINVELNIGVISTNSQ